MSDFKLSERELLILMVGVCESTLSSADRQRLNQSLRSDPTARHLYREYLYLDSQLYWHQTRELEAFPMGHDLQTSTIQRAPLASLTDGEYPLSSQSEIECEIAPTPSCRAKAQITAWPSLRHPRRWLGWAASLLLVGYFGTIAWFLVWDGFRALDEQQQAVLRRSNVSAALLTYADDAGWKPDSAAGALQHRILEVRSGLAKLTFSQGAEVVIGGPAEFEVRSSNGGFLRWGKFAAHVPPQAVGFEVETPTARVVDLGTDFRLQASPKDTQLAISSGEIDLFAMSVVADSDQKTASPSQRLTAGQAVAVTTTANGTAAVQETEFDPNWLAEIAPKSSLDQLPSPIVAYQSIDGVSGNQNTFHGGVGLDFEVRIPIRIYSFGIFDHLGDGVDPSTTPIVQLWSRNTQGTPNDPDDDVGGKLLATQKFTAADAGQLKLGHRFKPLPEPIELPVGSYSIVVYGLSGANPFVTADRLDFRADPGWTGVNNTVRGNNFGWSSPTHPLGSLTGKVGGLFARAQIDSFYGDTRLSKAFDLNDKISASGKLNLRNITAGWADIGQSSGLFIGYFSTNATSDEFIGVELKESGDTKCIRSRTRFHMPDAHGAESDWVDLTVVDDHTFDFTYDPDSGEHGRLTLCIGKSQKVTGDLTQPERQSKARFDAFGMGIISTLISENDPTKTAEVYLNDVSYSGCRKLGGTSVGTHVEMRGNTIMAIGTRWGTAEPGEFPQRRGDEPANCVAGSFEYSVRQTPQVTEEVKAK